VRKKPGFKRRSSPPPAARKLLLASLLSGLILLGALAIVFVPRALLYEPLPVLPRIAFTLNTSPGYRVIVSDVSAVRPLSDFNATYSRGAALLGSIDPLMDNATNGALTFIDVDHDRNLSIGDEFRVTSFTFKEVLRVAYKPGGAIVGYWPPLP